MSEQPRIAVNVHISITIENLDESINELAEEFGVEFVGQALLSDNRKTE